ARIGARVEDGTRKSRERTELERVSAEIEDRTQVGARRGRAREASRPVNRSFAAEIKRATPPRGRIAPERARDRPHRAIGTLRAREASGGSAGLRRFLDRETGVALLLLDLLEGESARKRILLVRDLRPFREKLGVLLGPILIALRELALRIDRIDRALGDAELAIDARVGIDHEHGGLVG